MYQIRKKFTFEMAHVLTTAYSKDCCQIHGHSYTLEVIIQSMSLNKDGMVIDFKLLKEIVSDKILKSFDHRLVIEKPENWDTLKNRNIFVETQLPWLKDIVTLSYNPTAENMVKDIYNRLYNELSHIIPSFRGLKIRLHETSTGWAEYGLEA